MIARKFKLKRNTKFSDGVIIPNTIIHTAIKHHRVFDEVEDEIYQAFDFQYNGVVYNVALIDLRFTDEKLSDKISRLGHWIFGMN